LAILLKDFEELEKYSNLNTKQIDFLKKYPHPFTILTETSREFIFPKFLDKNIYVKIAFRI